MHSNTQPLLHTVALYNPTHTGTMTSDTMTATHPESHMYIKSLIDTSTIFLQGHGVTDTTPLHPHS